MMTSRRRSVCTAIAAAVCLLVATSAQAEQRHADPPRRLYPHPVWVLMLMENHGETVTVGGVFETKADADAFASQLPPPTTDRAAFASPSSSYTDGKLSVRLHVLADGHGHDERWLEVTEDGGASWRRMQEVGIR